MSTTRLVRTTDEEIINNYFLWLCGLVGISSSRSDHSRRNLAAMLHHQHFYWTVPNDGNREQDGIELREEYADKYLTGDCPCLDGPCTVLEMLVALSRRMDFELYDSRKGDRTHVWFWEMCNNLGLKPFSKDNPYDDGKEINNARIISRFLERMYSRNGEGGLFPLRMTIRNQKHVEIWYQMMEYLDENYA